MINRIILKYNNTLETITRDLFYNLFKKKIKSWGFIFVWKKY